MKGICLIFIVALFGVELTANAAPARKVLSQRLPLIQTPGNPIAPFNPTNRLNLAIGLPVHNRKALDDFLREVYDPASPNFHHYIRPKEFADQFGPTEEEYEAVVDFAKRNGFSITGRHSGRMVLEVNAASGDVERAFQVRMLTSPHPTENRKFFTPDSAPSVPADLPILEVSGLDDYTRPTPLSSAFIPLDTPLQSQAEWSGEGPSQTYIPKDFKAAYASDISATGAGQNVGLLEFDTCYAADIKAYETEETLPNTPLIHVPLPGATGVPGPFNVEAAADVEMAIGMAPGLSSVILYEAPRATNSYSSQYLSLLLRMAEDDAAGQLSSSWNPPTDSTLIQDQIFQQMAAQGQSFFQASGDYGAYADGIFQRADNPYVTVVGGTSLFIQIWGYSGPGGEYYYPVYAGETVWNGGGSNNVSGGGISTNYSIPFWQQGLDMSGNGGSTANRNSPDVAMVADGVYVRADNGKRGALGGTSVAAPLWAGFTALMNQQAAQNGLPNVGFLNPSLYTLGRGTNYSALFHDVTSGNNTTPTSPNAFYAVPGYDLCTGWGSPVGQSFVDALTIGRARLSIDPANGFVAARLDGGPFDINDETFTIANAGWMPANWSIGNIPSWLDVSVTGGVVNPNESSVVSVSLDDAAVNLGPGIYSATVVFSNLTGRTETPFLFTLQVFQLGSLLVTLTPGAFEAGARWRVDGGAWQDSDAVVTGLLSTNHVIEFSSAPNWNTPSNQTVAIVGNQTNVVQGVYGQQFGSLTVTLSPPDSVIGGAHWQVDGGPWMNSGDIVYDLAVTNHIVSFSNVSGWITPAQRVAMINGNQTTTNQAIYAEQYVFTTIAGKPGIQGSSDGSNDGALFSSPNGITRDTNGNLFVVDSGNNVIRRLTPDGTNWVVTTIAGSAQNAGTNDGANGLARFNYPLGIAADSSGNLFVTDTGNSTVRRLVAQGTTWAVNTIAGSAGLAGQDDGTNSDARFQSPTGIAVDTNGLIYVTDMEYSGAVRLISPSGTDWEVSTFSTFEITASGQKVTSPISFYYPYSLVTLPGTSGPYVSCYTIYNSINELEALYQYFAVDILGVHYVDYSTANLAEFFSSPNGGPMPEGVAADSLGNIYAAGSGDHTIRKLAPLGMAPTGFPNYFMSEIGGVPFTVGAEDGTNNVSRFNGPRALAADKSGTLYISDTGNHTIRMGVPLLRRVQISAAPDDPSVQAAFFQVDGGAWTRVGSYVRLSAGEHTISFGPRSGWVTPSNQVVTVSGDEVFTGVYDQQFGSLQVTLNPSNAVAAGAQWKVDDGDWQPSGATVSGLTLVAHLVSFANISGWVPLPDQVVSIAAGTNILLSSYTAIDSSRPTLAIVSPKPGQTWSGSTVTLSGTAADNVAVASIWYQVNRAGWYQAVGTNQWQSPDMTLGRGTVTAQVYAVDTAGNISQTNTISFNNTPSVLLTLTSVGTGTISPNLNGQLLTIGKNYSLTAKPTANWIFDHWSGDISSVTPKISFVAQTNMSLQANFIPSPYPAIAGTYAGIFYDTNTVTQPGSGFFSAKLSTKGTFSATILIEGGSYRFSGSFSSQGTSSNYISRTFNSISVQLSLDSANGEIAGELSATQWKSHLTAYRSAFSKTQPAPLAGQYTLCLIPGGDGSALQPGGIGFGSATVSPAGTIKFAGTLGDGTTASQSAFVSKEGLWPFYISLYSGTGALLGWLDLSDPANGLHGTLMWMKRPQLTTPGFYPAGFSLPVEAQGSSYHFTNGPVLNFSNGLISLEGGNLAVPLTNAISFTGQNGSGPGPNPPTLSISSSSGVFHGSIRNPATGKNVPFSGAVLQNTSAGYGVFSGTNQTGRVSLTPTDALIFNAPRSSD